MNASYLTACGLPGIREIPYGVHMCHFYRSRDELAAALVPYFTAGLRNNERCIWITAEPLDAAAARAELGKAGLDVAAAIESGGLVIRDHSDWYSGSAELRGNDVIGLWLAEEQHALEQGYAGVRITGNVTFLTPETWHVFMEYEATLNAALRGRRIVTLCSYHLGRSSGTDVLDVIGHHHCTLDRPDQGWQIVTGALPPVAQPNSG